MNVVGDENRDLSCCNLNMSSWDNIVEQVLEFGVVELSKEEIHGKLQEYLVGQKLNRNDFDTQEFIEWLLSNAYNDFSADVRSSDEETGAVSLIEDNDSHDDAFDFAPQEEDIIEIDSDDEVFLHTLPLPVASSLTIQPQLSLKPSMFAPCTTFECVDRSTDEELVIHPPRPLLSMGGCRVPVETLEYANRLVFRNSTFRERQLDIIQATLSGEDVFVLMPTGGGKSLTYQLPAVVSKGLTVVVCPLLSLMQDQVQALCNMPSGGIPATYLSSQQGKKEAAAVFRELSKQRPTTKLLYVTPEQLVKSSSLQSVLQRVHERGSLSRLVVDEAHCVSQWGHEFRPDYKSIGKVRNEYFSTVPVMALTATATSEVKKDIIKSLHMRRSLSTFQVSFFRPNLSLHVVPKDTKKMKESGLPKYMEHMLCYIAERAVETGIVYCLSRQDTEQMAKVIREELEVPAAHYHAGMTPKQRIMVQNSWRSGLIKVVVATIAFGMGIDKADVRYVIHACMSKSLEGYYQEAGRAGRDGKPSDCILYYAAADTVRIQNIIRKGKKKKSYTFECELLGKMQDYCMERERCRHRYLIEYLGERWGRHSCGSSCDFCGTSCLENSIPRKFLKERTKGHVGFMSASAAFKKQKVHDANEPRKKKKDQKISESGASILGFLKPLNGNGTM